MAKGTEGLMKSGGFAQSLTYKILLPEEIRNLEQKIRGNALLNAAIGKELDKTIDAMNAGAEKAMTKALPIFTNAITNMSFMDAMKILTGGQGAATQYLKTNTNTELSQALQPEIKSALESVAIYNHWTPIVNTVNKNKKLLGLTEDVNPNLELYVTDKAMSALFKEIEIQENAIRKDPINRTTELLQKYLITLTNSKTPLIRSLCIWCFFYWPYCRYACARSLNLFQNELLLTMKATTSLLSLIKFPNRPLSVSLINPIFYPKEIHCHSYYQYPSKKKPFAIFSINKD